ncbi:MAG: type I methionyl aminopeptidase [Myxococcales bacterium]|nr:type I methionyl aminopeptidase [Myxococcales bacterium]
MIELKSPKEIDRMRKANHIVWEVLQRLKEIAEPGISTLDLDRIAEEYVRERGVRPAFKGLYGFPNALCTSVNEAVVHGIPNSTPLAAGDIVGVDFGAVVDDYYGDAAITLRLGEVDEETERLCRVTEECLHRAIARMRIEGRLSDLSHAVQSHAEAEGFSVVRDYVGHGIGRKPHEEPQVPNYGPPGRGYRLREGLVLALEPMINAGTYETRVLDDDWTVVTADGRMSAHFELTVALTAEGPKILNYDA